MSKQLSSSFRTHWQAISGERMYALVRWFIVSLLFALSLPFTTSLFPPSLQSEPVILVLWVYAIFSVVMSIVLFIPAAKQVLIFDYAGDILFIALVALLNGTDAIYFLPFFLIPLLAGAIRNLPLPSLGIGAAGALLFSGTMMFNSKDIASLFTLAFVLQVLMLVFIPWFTSTLMEQWGNHNRKAIEAADERRIQAQNETQAYRERMHVFATVSATLASTVDYKKMIDTALQEIQKLAPYKVALVVFPSGTPKELKVESIEPASPSDMGKTFLVQDGMIASMLKPSSISRIEENISDEPELRSLSSLRSCQTACIVPLRMKVTTYGLLIVASEQPNGFTQEHLEIVTSVANYLIVALHSTQMAADLRQVNSRLMSKEKEVRNMLASKLHDGPTQKVAQIMMQADFIKKAMKQDPSMVPQELDKFAALAEVANAEMRMTLFELRPMTLESDGLRAALTDYVDKLKLRSGTTKVQVRSKGSVDNVLSKDSESVIFDIIQESVNNALKHAKANNILITIERKKDIYTATIKDDGKGFEPAAAKEAASKRASFGLKNFDERAKMIEGTIEIDSAPGKGTTITITVALQMQSAA